MDLDQELACHKEGECSEGREGSAVTMRVGNEMSLLDENWVLRRGKVVGMVPLQEQ